MKSVFEKLVVQYLAEAEKAEKKSFMFSLFRGGVFIICITLGYFFFSNNSTLLGIITVLAIVAYYWLYKHHRRIEKSKIQSQTLASINQEESKRSQLELNTFPEGIQFIEENHPYQVDLDIFGRHSLFQLVNRCELDDSQNKLADWLSSAATEKEVNSRQEAVKELGPLTQWRQHFQSTLRIALSLKKKRNPQISSQDLIIWAQKNQASLNIKLWRAMSVALSLVSISLVILIAFAIIPYQLIYPSLIVNAIMLAYGVKRLVKITNGMDKAHYIVHTYASAIKILEKSDFSSDKIRDLQSKLTSNHVSATQSVAQLAKLMHRLEGRSNMLYAILDIPFLLDNHLLLDVTSWKESHQNDLSNWLDVIHEMECLSSIAGFSYANPSYSFPTISGEFHFSATEIGHPLINAEEKVRNSYSIQGKGSVDVITGSNMSGKSTFERTIGINMVLAQAGCPVDAKSLTMSSTQVFTSMRTKDNLEERTSSFYAELKRLAQLLDKIENQASTFFILDEILKGTNSQDRHSGSVALIKTLSQRKSFGIISTHDLELGSLSHSQNEVRNFSFNSTLDGDKIIFDYLLTEGICKSFNATQLMKNMGIFEK